MRILVIDDDEQMRVLLQQAMQWAGFEVVAAENGRQGQQLFEEQPADLIITDLIILAALYAISYRHQNSRSSGIKTTNFPPHSLI